jgi:hypothetical protein
MDEPQANQYYTRTTLQNADTSSWLVIEDRQLTEQVRRMLAGVLDLQTSVPLPELRSALPLLLLLCGGAAA